MLPEEAVLMCVRVFTWLWRLYSSVVSAYAVSGLVPGPLGYVKCAFICLQVLAVVVFDLLPLSHFPRISLTNRLLSIPSQLYTTYYAIKYVGPTLNAINLTAVVSVVGVLCVLETIYMIKLDYSRIE